MDRIWTTEPMTPLAYKPKDAATMLGISRSTVYQLIADGHLPARKLGTATIIRHCDLEAFLDATSFPPAI